MDLVQKHILFVLVLVELGLNLQWVCVACVCSLVPPNPSNIIDWKHDRGQLPLGNRESTWKKFLNFFVAGHKQFHVFCLDDCDDLPSD